MQAFPNLRADQVVDILFKSADDLGAAGADNLFGRGRLNIATAFGPIGETKLASTGMPAPIPGLLQVPSAVGDALQRNEMPVIVLDHYSRAFSYNYAQSFRQTETVGCFVPGGGKAISQTMSINGIDLFVASQGNVIVLLNSQQSPVENIYTAHVPKWAIASASLSPRVRVYYGINSRPNSQVELSFRSSNYSLTGSSKQQSPFVSSALKLASIDLSCTRCAISFSAERGNLLPTICEMDH